MGNGKATVKREAVAGVVEEMVMDKDAFVTEGGDEVRRGRLNEDDDGGRGSRVSRGKSGRDHKAEGVKRCNERGGVILVIFFSSLFHPSSHRPLDLDLYSS